MFEKVPVVGVRILVKARNSNADFLDKHVHSTSLNTMPSEPKLNNCQFCLIAEESLFFPLFTPCFCVLAESNTRSLLYTRRSHIYIYAQKCLWITLYMYKYAWIHAYTCMCLCVNLFNFYMIFFKFRISFCLSGSKLSLNRRLMFLFECFRSS